MRKQLGTLLALGAVVLLASLMFFIPDTLQAQAGCSLKMDVSSTPVTQLSPSDIDFEHFESRNLLFTVTITNSNEVELKAKLKGKVDIFLADGSNYPSAATFETEEFPIQPGNRTITNLNIGRNADIKTQQFTYSDEVKQRLQDIALATGKFPAGRYVFDLQLFDVACNPNASSDNGQVTFVLHNASRIELRSPSNGDMTNEFPFFEFFQEGERAVLTVAEKTENQSAEDAIERNPPMLETELAGQNSFLYTGGRPLEPGKTYVWQVVSKSTASGGGSADVASEIRTFTVSSTVPVMVPGSTVLDQLRNIFGSKFPEVFEKIVNGGYQSSGQYTNNGVPIDLNELQKLLDGLGNPDDYNVSFE